MVEKLDRQSLEASILYTNFLLSREMHKKNKNHAARIQELERNQFRHDARMAELRVELMRTHLRPHRMYGAVVSYVPSEDTFMCRIPPDLEDDMGDMTLGVPIVAYGQTPAQACDNFDHLWVHGGE